jgi:hypothetical protein
MTKRKLWLQLVVPADYRKSLGEVIIQWAYFEMDFDYLLEFVRFHPEARKLADEPPNAFKRRRKLLLDSCRVAFVDCPPLLHRMEVFCSDVARAKASRDHIAHCRWAASGKDGSLSTHVWRGGKYVDMDIDTDWLHNLAVDISRLTARSMSVHLAPSFKGTSEISLTPDELYFLRQFRSHNSPNHPRLAASEPPLESSRA